MKYYYNQDGKFRPESSKEYKTDKGAIDKMTKAGVGAVFDETGKLIASIVDEKDVPKGALETNPDGSVPAFDADGNQVGTVSDEEVARLTGELESGQPTEQMPEQTIETDKTIFCIHTTCDRLNIRTLPDAKSPIVGEIREKEPNKKDHPICRVENGWGKLNEVPGGWIQLAFGRVVS